MKSFLLDTGLACQYGVDEALFLQSLGYWIEKNHANGVNRVAGRTWTYNSLPALEGMFPFWTRRVLQRIIGKLGDAGAILTAQHNPASRVTWYALSDEVLDALGLDECRSDAEPYDAAEEPALPVETLEKVTAPNGAMADSTAPNGATHGTKRCDDICNNINTANTPKAPTGGASEYPPHFDRFWEAYPRKLDKRRAFRAWKKAGLDRCDLPDILTALERWKRCDQWQDDRYIPHPTTWLNNRRWETSPDAAPPETDFGEGGYDVWT